MRWSNETIGWISSAFLLLCGVPQALKSIKDGHSGGISVLFIWFWLLGEITGTIYIATFKEISLPLLTNYVFNVIIVFIIIFYKYFPRIKGATGFDRELD
jgi:uncharacterized protein with PQ loop repeat